MTRRTELLAEAAGTFLLVLVGTGAAASGRLSNLAVAMSFGLIVTLAILLFGRMSGAHINPAVTLAMLVQRRMGARQAMGYVAAQLVGAMLASQLVLRGVQTGAAGATELAAELSTPQGLAIEVAITFSLVLIILLHQRYLARWAPYSIGATVFLHAWWAGPLTGASMNPARSIGPIVALGAYDLLWLYVLGPLMGAVAAAAVHRVVSRTQRLQRGVPA